MLFLGRQSSLFVHFVNCDLFMFHTFVNDFFGVLTRSSSFYSCVGYGSCVYPNSVRYVELLKYYAMCLFCISQIRKQYKLNI